MKRAYQILQQKQMVNGEPAWPAGRQQLFYLKNKIKLMKRIALFIGILLFSACSSTRFVDSWKNPGITSFEPKKMLVMGMTDNLTARKIFEEKLKNAFVLRNIYAVESTDVIDGTFTNAKKSEQEIDEMTKKIAAQGFDTVVITSLKGVDERVNYHTEYYPAIGYRWSRFGRYYYWYQDIYYTPQYYDSYKVYNVETVIYNINEDDTKSLVWVGALNLVDPQTITSTVNEYVDKIIKQLEHEKLIKALN
ncbi:MAG TPA: hypothetical protein VIO43_08215 [Lutibacter sp.]